MDNKANEEPPAPQPPTPPPPNQIINDSDSEEEDHVVVILDTVNAVAEDNTDEASDQDEMLEFRLVREDAPAVQAQAQPPPPPVVTDADGPNVQCNNYFEHWDDDC